MTLTTQRSLELIHIDVSVPNEAAITGRIYALSILDDFTAKSDVFLLKTKDEVYKSLVWYKNRSERGFNGRYRLLNIRLDRTGEHRREYVREFLHEHGVHLNFSPAHASESK